MRDTWLQPYGAGWIDTWECQLAETDALGKTQPQAMWMPILPQLLAGGRMPPRGAPWSTNAALVCWGVHLGTVTHPNMAV